MMKTHLERMASLMIALTLLLALAPTLAGAVPVTGGMGGSASSTDFCFELAGPGFETNGCIAGGVNSFPPAGPGSIDFTRHETIVDGIRYYTDHLDCDEGNPVVCSRAGGVTLDQPALCDPCVYNHPFDRTVPATMTGHIVVQPDPALAPLYEFVISGRGTLRGQVFEVVYPDVDGEPLSVWDSAFGYQFTVPEPSSFTLLGLTLVGLVAWRRR